MVNVPWDKDADTVSCRCYGRLTKGVKARNSIANVDLQFFSPTDTALALL